MRGGAWSVVVVLLALFAWPTAASAQRVEPYEDRAGEFRNILPPGSNGVANAGELAEFTASGGESGRPEHNNDQLAPYEELVFNSPGLERSQIGEFFKDGSFGVPRGQVEERYQPCGSPGRPCDPRDDGPLGGHPCRDVTVVRDEGFGVPHIYGSTRAGTMCAAGYVAAEDRLFLVDVLRHAGRAELSSFAGGAEGNREMDRAQWAIAPYTEDDLQRQVDQFDELYGAEGARLQRDLEAYVAGLNQFAFEARANPLTEMPGEYYVLLGQENPTAGPQPFDETDVQPFQETDVVAIASLVGGIFGKGGGRELDSALFLESLQERFDGDVGEDVWEDFRSAEDPEAPTTVLGERFPYLPRPDEPASGSLALPDEGTAQETDVVASSSDPGGGGSAAGLLDGLTESSGASSNALLVSGAESRSGHPLAVFGPQTGYFSPQLLMEMDIHGPGIDARGAAFAGTNLYVQLGRGDDYAWSATSAGQDNTDTFALDLCEPPGGGAATLESDHYSYRGECLPFEVLERRNAWTMEAPGQPPPGTETLRVNRTRLGLEVARATVDGTPVVYVQLRATYMHEVDSARGFADFNDPRAINGPRDYQRAANKISYTFNWFYTDDEDIAYFNSGENPERAPGIDPNFPVHACPDADCEFEWRDFRPIRGEGLPGRTGNRARYTPFNEHPQTINQSYLTSWNNKQARGFRASDSNFEYQTLYRSVPLDERILRETRGDRTMTLVELIDAMEDAGTVDLRGDQVLPWMLQALRPGGARAAAEEDAAADPSARGASGSAAGDTTLGTDGVGEAGGAGDRDATAANDTTARGDDGSSAQATANGRGDGAGSSPSDEATTEESADRDAADGNATAAAAAGTPDVRERACPDDLTRRRAVDLLADWHAFGANRRDMDDDGRYAHSCAIQVMDAWWPLLVEAMFVPTLGQDAYDSRLALGGIDNEPNNGGAHLGSAYQGGFYGYVQKDLRTLLGDRVRGRYSRTYCGGGESREGTLTRCRRVLRSTLSAALDVPREETYGGDAICENEPDLDAQYCFDTVAHTPAGAITQPLIHWINRPTFQQVVEVRGDRSGGGGGGGGGGGDGPGDGSGPAGGGGGGSPGADPSGDGGGSGGGTGDPTAGSGAPVGAAADATAEAADGGALPFTGLALGALALIGALLAMGGALLRRRSRGA